MTAATITQLPATQAPERGPSFPAVRPIIPRTYQEVAAMAKATCAAGIARKYENDPSRVAAVMMSGMELGLKPLAALRLFWMSPEGQPSLSARGMLAVVQSSGLLEHWADAIEGDGDAREACVIVKRRGLPRIVRRFSMADAKKAGLLSKQNWSKYADRMLWNRAVSFALSDQFSDLLGGLYEPSEVGGPVIDENGEELVPFEQPKVRQFEVLVPAMDPEYFPQTSQGFDDCLKFMTDTVLDGNGGAGIVLLNLDLLDRLAKAEDGKRQADVESLKELARQDLDQKIDRENDTADETEGSH
jgi:hypothetical protein